MYKKLKNKVGVLGSCFGLGNGENTREVLGVDKHFEASGVSDSSYESKN